ncbi:MAG: hypothetical protein AcusKO_00970 [Acuticoccus sp.]
MRHAIATMNADGQDMIARRRPNRRGIAAALVLALAAAFPATASPALEAADAAGARVRLPAATGEPRILHLWATWCAPCLAELPALDAALAAHPDMAGRITVLSVDSAPFARVSGYLDDLGVSLRTLKLVAGNAGVSLGVSGYPSTLFLDGDGAVVDRVTGPLDWTAPETLTRLRRHFAR